MKIRVSDYARELLAATSPTGKLSMADSTRLPDGRWEVDLDLETAAGLALVDPDPETAIRQLLTGARKQ